MLVHEVNTCFGVSSSLILRPSKRNLRDDTGTPTRSEYDFFSFPICVVIFTLKWISFESWPTTFNLMYSVSVLASACHKIRKIDFKDSYGTESNTVSFVQLLKWIQTYVFSHFECCWFTTINSFVNLVYTRLRLQKPKLLKEENKKSV